MLYRSNYSSSTPTPVFTIFSSGKEVGVVEYFIQVQFGQNWHKLAVVNFRVVSKEVFHSIEHGPISLAGNFLNARLLVPVSCIAKPIALVPYSSLMKPLTRAIHTNEELYLPIELDSSYDFEIH